MTQVVEAQAEIEGQPVDRPLVLHVEADAGRLPLRFRVWRRPLRDLVRERVVEAVAHIEHVVVERFVPDHDGVTGADLERVRAGDVGGGEQQDRNCGRRCSGTAASLSHRQCRRRGPAGRPAPRATEACSVTVMSRFRGSLASIALYLIVLVAKSRAGFALA